MSSLARRFERPIAAVPGAGALAEPGGSHAVELAPASGPGRPGAVSSQVFAPLQRGPHLPSGVVFVGVVTVLLVLAAIAVGSRVVEDDPAAAYRETFADVPGVTVDAATGAVGLPDGTELDPEAATAVAAVYDYLDRRPGATRDEIRRRVYPKAPAGYEDPSAWWTELVDPALRAIADDGGHDSRGDDGDDDRRGSGGASRSRD